MRCSFARRLLLRAAHAGAAHPIYIRALPRPSPSPADGGDGEPISSAEVRSLARADPEEEAGEGAAGANRLRVLPRPPRRLRGPGIGRTREEAADSARFLDLADLHPEKVKQFTGLEQKATYLKMQNHVCDQIVDSISGEVQLSQKQIGDTISTRDKINYLIDLFNGLKDSKEAVYGALDAWVAWEKDFPLPALRRALTMLEKNEQWHRIIQVIKWMLSKGQGNTMGTHEQLIRALEKDHRAEEAHTIWVRKFEYDLHSAPLRVCELMIGIYYRNNMLERLVKLFEGLEMLNRKLPDKSIVQKVAKAYEILGLSDRKNKVIEKYEYLFKDMHSRKLKKASRNKQKSETSNSQNLDNGQDHLITSCKVI